MSGKGSTRSRRPKETATPLCDQFLPLLHCWQDVFASFPSTPAAGIDPLARLRCCRRPAEVLLPYPRGLGWKRGSCPYSKKDVGKARIAPIDCTSPAQKRDASSSPLRLSEGGQSPTTGSSLMSWNSSSLGPLFSLRVVDRVIAPTPTKRQPAGQSFLHGTFCAALLRQFFLGRLVHQFRRMTRNSINMR